ncbi:MAG: nucleotidyl transferase AbiEii/AbiGii toxin family protein [Candidatus Bathyarchaeia archaeon]
MYDRNQTEVSKGALVELALALGLYKDDAVLVGGWTPYFLSQGYFEHCGSIDIDLVLRPSIMARYESIRDIVLSLGYEPTKNPFRLRRELISLNGAPFHIDLDFLTEPEARSQLEDLIEVQEGLQAVFIPGCSIVFTYNYLETVRGVLPAGGEGVANIKTSDIVGTLTMKGLALGRPRKLAKDSYDIYAVAGFHGGDPYKAASFFKQLVETLGNNVKPQVTDIALKKIRDGFASPNHYAAQAVSRFVEEDVSTDASERVSAFISKI